MFFFNRFKRNKDTKGFDKLPYFSTKLCVFFDKTDLVDTCMAYNHFLRRKYHKTAPENVIISKIENM
jgi:hypothetical protein